MIDERAHEHSAKAAKFLDFLRGWLTALAADSRHYPRTILRNSFARLIVADERAFLFVKPRWKTSSQLRNANVQRHGSVLHFKLSPRETLSWKRNTRTAWRVERKGKEVRRQKKGGIEPRKAFSDDSSKRCTVKFEAVNFNSTVQAPAAGCHHYAVPFRIRYRLSTSIVSRCDRATFFGIS